MKKLYNSGKTRRIHPSPPPHPPPPAWAALPAALFTLAASLPAEEQEVLSYLLSAGAAANPRRQHRRTPHSPDLTCACFSCYTTFWARWDASPNRHIIHRIIDAFEETLESQERKRTAGRRRRRIRGADVEEEGKVVVVGEKGVGAMDREHVADDDGGHADVDAEGQSSVRKLVSFIGERVWGVWGR